MTDHVTDGSGFPHARFEIETLVEIPSDLRFVNQAEFSDLLEHKAVETELRGYKNYAPSFSQGVLVADASRVESTQSLPDPLVHRKFSKLGMPNGFAAFATGYGFLGAAGELSRFRLDDGRQFVFEAISDWRVAVIEIAMLCKLIDLRTVEDDAEVARLTGGFFGPHQIAYTAKAIDDVFDLKLLGSEDLSETSPLNDQNNDYSYVAGGIIKIGNGRDSRAQLNYSTDPGVMSHVYDFLSSRVNPILNSHAKFLTLAKDLRSSQIGFSGLRTMVVRQLLEELMNPELYQRCISCLDPFMKGRNPAKHCSDRCRQRAYREGKKQQAQVRNR